MGILRKPKTFVITVGSLVLFYALAGFVIIPRVLEAKLPSILSEQLGKPVVVKEIQLNPFALSLNIHEFEIQELDHTPLLGFEELFVNFQLSSIFRKAFTFDRIRLVVPYAVIVMRPDGSLNVADLAKAPPTTPAPDSESPAAASAQEAELPPVEVYHLSIEQGVVEFFDEADPTPFVADIVPIELSLNNFSTHPTRENPYTLTAEIMKGGTLEWKGIVSLDPVRSEGTLSVNGLNLRTAWEYLQDVLQFEISKGTLNLDTHYRFEMLEPNHQLMLSSAEIHLQDFNLTEKGNSESLITIPSFDVEGITVDVAQKQVNIRSVRSQDSQFVGWVNPDGTVNYQALFAPPGTQADESALGVQDASSSPESSIEQIEQKEKAAWSVALKELMIENYAVDFEDRSQANPAILGLESINLQTQEVSTDLTKPINFSLSLMINQTGTAEVTGRVQVEPFMADLELAVSHLALKPFQPYADPFMQVDFLDGAVDLQAKTTYHGASADKPKLSFGGQVAVSNLKLAKRGEEEKFLTWESLSLKELALQVEPTNVSIGEILLTNPLANVAIAADRTINVVQALSPSPESTAPAIDGQKEKEPTGEGQPGSPVPVEVDSIKVVNGAVQFSDRSLNPNVEVGLQGLTGTIKGISSEQLAKADVDLKGKVDKYAPFAIRGQINPLSKDAYTDLTLLFKNWGLTAVSPYSGKYAGYPITQGKLSLAMKYKVSENLLRGENKLLIDQLTMGEATGSPDAPSLPIPLALALLKDRHGRINIDLSVKGNLNDPEFSYWGLVFQSLGNVITKAAASPFSALGNLVGVDAESLQYIEFSPGKAELGNSAQDKLVKLAQALKERPGLRLEITGSVDPQMDRLALADERLKKQLQESKWREMQTTAPSASTNLDQVVVTRDDAIRLVQKLYEENFPKPIPSDRGAQPKSAERQEVQQRDAAPGSSDKPPRKEPADKPMVTFESMKQKLVDTIPIEEAELRHLAQQRANTIRDYIIQVGEIPQQRVFLIQVNLNPETSKGSVRSQLTLAAD